VELLWTAWTEQVSCDLNFAGAALFTTKRRAGSPDEHAPLAGIAWSRKVQEELLARRLD